MIERDPPVASGAATISPEEMKALMDGIADGSIGTSAGLMPRSEVGLYQFGADADQMPGDLHALQLTHERFSRSLRRIVQPLLRTDASVSVGKIENTRFEDFMTSLDSSFLSLSVAGVDPLRGKIVVVIEPKLISTLVDSFFGGRGLPTDHGHVEFTPTEERMIQRIMDSMMVELGAAWADIFPLRFSTLSSESRPQLFSVLDSSEMVLVSPFDLHVSGRDPFRIHILYRVQMLKPLAPLLCSKVQNARDSSDAKWRMRLHDAITEVELPVRSVLAEPAVSMADIMNLAPGDILPIELTSEIRLLVERAMFCTGVLGETGGAAAIQVKSFGLPGAWAGPRAPSGDKAGE